MRKIGRRLRNIRPPSFPKFIKDHRVVFYLLVSTIALSAAPVFSSTVYAVSFSVAVIDTHDDAEEDLTSGSMSRSSSDLEMPFDVSDQQIVGIRFQDIDIPPTVSITSAFLRFTAKAGGSSTTNLTIFGEDGDSAGEYSSSNDDISTRNKATASAAWNSIPAWTTDLTYDSPDLTSVVQEIIDRPGWARHNGMAFIIEGTTGVRSAHSYASGRADKAVQLFIEYDLPTTPLPAIIPIEPDGAGDTTDLFYETTWDDGNPTGQSLSLFYDLDNAGADGTLIVQDMDMGDGTNNYFWNTAHMPEGSYYIYAKRDNGINPVPYGYSTGTLTVAHDTACLDPNSGTNIILNNSFESGGSNPSNWGVGLPTGDRSYSYEWVNDSIQAHTGDRAIKIGNATNFFNYDSPWNDRVIINSDLYDISPNKKFLLTFWLKTNNADFGHVMTRVKYYDGSGSQLDITGHGTDTFRSGGKPNWSPIAFLLDPPHWSNPPNPDIARAQKMRLNFQQT